MKKILLVFSLFMLQIVYSQKEEVKNYEWEAAPKFKEIPANFQNYPAVVLLDYRLYDNSFGVYSKRVFIAKHIAIKILKEEAIGEYNKVSIDKEDIKDYRDLRVRVIKPNGKIEELPKERMKEK